VLPQLLLGCVLISILICCGPLHSLTTRWPRKQSNVEVDRDRCSKPKFGNSINRLNQLCDWVWV
jgi:hypothetical protein